MPSIQNLVPNGFVNKLHHKKFGVHPLTFCVVVNCRRQFTLDLKRTVVFGKNINRDFVLFLHELSLQLFFRLEKKGILLDLGHLSISVMVSQICQTKSVLESPILWSIILILHEMIWLIVAFFKEIYDDLSR